MLLTESGAATGDGGLAAVIEDFEATAVLAIGADDEELEEYKRVRLEALLEKANVEENENGERIPKYEEALAVAKSGFSIIYKRDISEIGQLCVHHSVAVVTFIGRIPLKINSRAWISYLTSTLNSRQNF